MNEVELGFVGAAVKGAAKIGKGIAKIGKVFKKKKQAKKKKGKVMQMPDIDIVGSVPAAQSIIKDAAASASSNEDLVRAVVSAVPGPVRDVVLEALKAQSQNVLAKEQTINSLAGQIDESLKPQIIAMLSTLQAQQLSRQATYEHDALVAKAKFEDNTLGGLQNVMERLSSIEARLNRSAIIPGSKVNVFGNKNVLEG